MGGKFLLKLNICARPIANKYCEGKMKRTLKRELEVPEIADREANRISSAVKFDSYESGTLSFTAREWKA